MKETKLNQEINFDWEEEVTQETISFMRKQMEHAYAMGQTPRDFHSKGHSWVRAEFTVEENIDPKFKIGLFKTPKTYQAWIRYSNTSNGIQKDKVKDGRGMSIKLFDVPGEKLVVSGESTTTMDLLTFSPQIFLTRDSKQFLGFVKSFLGGTSLFTKLKFGLLNPGVLKSVATGFKSTASLVNINYFSGTPYALGPDMAIKYVITQNNPVHNVIPKDPSANFLLQNLQGYLSKYEANFDFNVQPQTDPKKEPIEDGLRVWKSPHYKVASIHIPKQTVTTQNLVDLSENSAYNPWRTLEEHRPLGNINRVRREVYKQIADFRHERNNTPIVSPEPGSVPEEGATPPLQA